MNYLPRFDERAYAAYTRLSINLCTSWSVQHMIFVMHLRWLAASKIRGKLVSGASYWSLLRKYTMMHGPQNIKDKNVNREDCCLRHLYPLSLLFATLIHDYLRMFSCVWVRARARMISGCVCAHRSIIRVCVVKVLVPFFWDRDIVHAGSYFSTYCTVPASPCATVVASLFGCPQLGLVLWQLRRTTQTTNSQHLDFRTFNLLLLTICFGQSCDKTEDGGCNDGRWNFV